ncbi:MAG: hypothetical protein Q4D19_00925 [Lautropia sp.]|nr:hypothetical protein [Lautropia sp.]
MTEIVRAEGMEDRWWHAMRSRFLAAQEGIFIEPEKANMCVMTPSRPDRWVVSAVWQKGLVSLLLVSSRSPFVVLPVKLESCPSHPDEG